MFEQSTLPSGPASKRLWATCVGMSGEALLVGLAIVAPMVFPQVLPRTTLITSLLPPVPQGRPKAEPDRPRATQAKAHPATQFRMGALVIPIYVPKHAEILVAPPPDVATGGSVIGGMDTADGGGSGSRILKGILGGDATPPPRAPVVAVTRSPEPPPPAPIIRVRAGGRVQPAALLRRVEPVYPQIAKQMRVSGAVELEGVIGTDGHIRELRVVSGHPLLTRAALDAVSQWTYAPTRLNSDLVEVITTITVIFHLN